MILINSVKHSISIFNFNVSSKLFIIFFSKNDIIILSFNIISSRKLQHTNNNLSLLNLKIVLR